VTINQTPLASFCTIVARAQNAGPWIDNTDLAVSCPTEIQTQPDVFAHTATFGGEG